MKLGLKLWSINLKNYSFDAIKLFEENIYQYIELYVVPGSLKDLNQWKIIKKNHKIPFIIHCPHFAHGFNLALKEKKENNLEIYKEVKIFADELSAKYIIFHGGVDGNIEETAAQLANINEPRALIENKPYLAIPNKMNGTFCRGYNEEEIEKVIKTANCGFCFDFGHAVCSANSQKRDIYEYCKKIIKIEPKMFHLTDCDDLNSEYDSHSHLGKGQLDIKKIIQLLPKDAIITLETDKDSKENLDDFVYDVNYLKELINE